MFLSPDALSGKLGEVDHRQPSPQAVGVRGHQAVEVGMAEDFVEIHAVPTSFRDSGSADDRAVAILMTRHCPRKGRFRLQQR